VHQKGCAGDPLGIAEAQFFTGQKSFLLPKGYLNALIIIIKVIKLL